MPFRLPLTSDLPSSFMYAGDLQSLLKVEYYFCYQFIGLIPTPHGVPETQLLNQDKIYVLIRAVDKMPKLELKQDSESKFKALIGDNGVGRMQVSLQCDTFMVGEQLTVRVLIDNTKSKLPFEGLKINLHREIKAFGKTTAGETKEFTDKQAVLKLKRNLKIAKLMPDLVAEDFVIRLLNEGNKEVETENNRFQYCWDYLDTLTHVPPAAVEFYRKLLHSQESEFIKVSYQLEIEA